jgi:hypothetical protein
MTILVGGPFDKKQVTGNDVYKLWIIFYTLNGNPWVPGYGVFHHNFPKGVMRHGYRKQKNGNFNYAWSRANDEDD